MGNRADLRGIRLSLGGDSSDRYRCAFWSVSDKNFTRALRQDYVIRDVIAKEKSIRFILCGVNITRIGDKKILINLFTSSARLLKKRC